MRKTKILLTGAGGFVGKQVLPLLLEDDSLEVLVLSRNPDKFENSGAYRLVKGDLQNKESLISAFANCDVLMNLAAEVRNKEQLHATNVKGTDNLIEAVLESEIKKVIHLSSVGVIGKNYSATPYLVSENEAQNPQNAYEISKSISEKKIIEALSSKVDLLIFRPTNVFGEYHPFSALLHLMKHIQQKKPLIYAKNARVNYLYVRDLAHILVWSLKVEHHAMVYNVGSTMPLSSFYHLLSEKLKVKTRILRLPTIFFVALQKMGISKFQSVSNAVSYSDAELKKHYEYPFGMEKGLENTILFYQSNHKL